MVTGTESTAGAEENVNGEGPMRQGDDVLLADAVRKQHEAEEAHRATVEEAIDEEDLLHPPPSQLRTGPDDAATMTERPAAPMSAKAAGKQKAQDGSQKPGAASERTKASLDTDSHESFPELGSGLQPRSSRPMTTAWGSKKSPSVNAAANGTAPEANGYPKRTFADPLSNPSSRPSTPASSGMATPNSNAAASIPPTSAQAHQRGLLPQAMSIPGRYSERISLFPQEMKSRGQLKKPIPDVLRDINRRSKATVQMTSGAGGAVHFDAKGPVDAVRLALKEVAKELGSKQSIKVSVPASVRPHLIGRQGAIVQAISQRTGASIQIPKPTESAPAPEEDDDTMIDVVIEGDSVAAAMARREVESIVNERTSSVSLKMKDIPVEFYPFLAGPHNSHVSALEEGRDLRIHIPHHNSRNDQLHQGLAGPREHPVFSSAAGTPILVSGERLAAQAARADLAARAEQLRRQLTFSHLDINRGQHQFVLGEKGASLHDFLEETGCSVILPPASHDSETVTIVGPPDKIDNGINKVMELATSMQMNNIDISRLHPNAPSGPSVHARNLTRYLQHRRELERLEKLYDAHITLPVADEGPVAWEIYSREGKNIIRARTDIINIVNGHPPAKITHVDMDPFYHQHLQAQYPKNIMTEHGVQLVFPKEDEDVPEILLIYEGPSAEKSEYEIPKKQPTPQELQQFEKALEEAKRQLIGLVNLEKKIVSRKIEVPRRFHEKVQKFVMREQQGHSATEPPVQVRLGNSRSRFGQPLGPQRPASDNNLEDGALLRGHVESVDALAEKILAFVAEEKENERERGYTLTFDFPQKFSNYLIGRKGDNIRKYREEFDVDIRVHDGKVEIKGPKAKAEAAKARIIGLEKKLADEATHVLKIHPQYHKNLIGTRGSQVNRLQDRYNVRIRFPRSTPSSSANDNHSVADSASDVGGNHTGHRSSQEQDEVIVRGPRKNADEARDELLSLLQWTVDNSHTASVSVAQSQVPSLIGQGGREMERMRLSTGAQIDVPDVKRDSPSDAERVSIRIKGTKKQVDEAKQLLEQRAKTFDESVATTIDVDKRHHKSLIGSGGANIREIVMKAGGPDDRRELARMVRFPRLESDETSIRVEGNKAVVDSIVASIRDIVQRMETEVVEAIEVPPEKHRSLIGRGGETRKMLESQFNVSIDIPRQTETGSARSSVKITGQPENVEKAKAHIESMTKHQEGETIQIPRRAHNVVSENGQLFRRLKNEYKVNVDHAGHQPPRRPTASEQRSNVNGGTMPLITDETSSDDFSWRIHDINDAADEEEGDIPWNLRGSPENVARARELLEKNLEEAQRQSTTGYLILPDPRTYRFVIGPGGSQVNSVRDKTGCKINVPRDQTKGEAIEIRGEKEKVEEARDIILELVREGTGRGGRRGLS